MFYLQVVGHPVPVWHHRPVAHVGVGEVDGDLKEDRILNIPLNKVAKPTKYTVMANKTRKKILKARKVFVLLEKSTFNCYKCF